MTKASSHILHLRGCLQDLETLQTSQKNTFLKDLQENKKRYREAKEENLQLHGKIMMPSWFIWVCSREKVYLGYISVSLQIYSEMNC